MCLVGASGDACEIPAPVTTTATPASSQTNNSETVPEQKPAVEDAKTAISSTTSLEGLPYAAVATRAPLRSAVSDTFVRTLGETFGAEDVTIEFVEQEERRRNRWLAAGLGTCAACEALAPIDVATHSTRIHVHSRAHTPVRMHS